MSYTPNTWQTGDTVTAEKLNAMETGIANAANAFVVTLTPTALDYSGTIDKTWGEVDEAYKAGKTIAFKFYNDQNGSYLITTNVVAYSGSGTQSLWFSSDLLVDGVGFVEAYSAMNPSPDDNTYSTIIYPLTPMS